MMAGAAGLVVLKTSSPPMLFKPPFQLVLPMTKASPGLVATLPPANHSMMLAACVSADALLMLATPKPPSPLARKALLPDNTSPPVVACGPPQGIKLPNCRRLDGLLTSTAIN